MTPNPTTKSPIEMPAIGIKLSDIYYILFRRKWLISGFFIIGLLAAVAVYFAQRQLYWSEAKLLVRYVIDTKSVESGIGTQVKSVDYGGDSILNSELEILTSLDLCEEVASLVGPEKIFPKAGTNLIAAAVAIYKGLTVENPRRSNIIKVRVVHEDPAVCQAILRQLIESYFKRHMTIHRAASGYDEVLSVEAQKLLTRIRQHEEELRSLKSKAGVLSVEDAKRNLADQLARLRQEIFASQAMLAENRVIVEGYSESPSTNQVDNATNTAAIPLQTVNDYKAACARLDAARNREFELRAEYKNEHPLLKSVRAQIAEFQKIKADMEAETPKLASLHIPQAGASPAATSSDSRLDPSRLLALEAKIRVLTNQVASVRADIITLDGLEGSIADVERKLQLAQKNYMHLASGVEAARFDEALGSSKMSNIQPVQTPSPPAPNVSQRLKLVAGTFVGLFCAGLALAFILELLLDRTVRHSSDFETKFQMPLFLSIPKLGLNGHAKFLPLPVPAEPSDAAHGVKNTWNEDHPLRPFIDGLRDRTLIHFEGDVHKPKLIGITSCRNGSGATSIAAGLAGALSETGDGNVLLLNLDFDSQSVHPFYRGELTCGLEDAVESEKRRSGMVLNNLYVATAGNPADPETQNLSKQLTRVVPKLRAADYDYIVFDLPPTTPTTMTARLAGMMDLVIVVVESGKDTQDDVKQVARLLSRSKARVSAVLNKVKNPVPRWLQTSAS